MGKKLFKNIVIYQVVLTAIASILLLFMVNGSFSLGFLIGSFLSMMNFLLLVFLVTKIFLGEPKTQIMYAFLFMIKLSVLGGIIFLLFKNSLFELNIIGFIVGISTLFVVITVVSVLYGSEAKKELELSVVQENVDIEVA